MARITAYAAATTLNEGMSFISEIDTDSNGIFETRRVTLATLRASMLTSPVTNGASAVGHLFNTVAFSTAGAKLASFQNNSVEKFYIDKDGDFWSNTGDGLSGVANGASAIGWKLNTVAYSTAGAKLLSLQNNSVEKFYVDKDGDVWLSSGYGLSGVADGASAEAWVLDTVALADAAAKSFVLKNNGTAIFSVNKDGVLTSAGRVVSGGALYFGTPAATTLGVATPALAAGATVSQGVSSDITVSATNRLTYTGTRTKVFLVIASVTLTKAAGTASVGALSVYENGAPVTGLETLYAITATENHSVTVVGAVTLATNDYVEVWLETDTGDDLTVQAGTLSLLEAA